LIAAATPAGGLTSVEEPLLEEPLLEEPLLEEPLLEELLLEELLLEELPMDEMLLVPAPEMPALPVELPPLPPHATRAIP
jgi:hypothetical protein